MLGIVLGIIAIVISLSALAIQMLALRKSIDNIASALGHRGQPE
jgi:hypothetical protein